jgi:hypothetical protein
MSEHITHIPVEQIAETEHVPVHPHLEQYPDAIQDPDKARFMADASADLEENSAFIRNTLKGIPKNVVDYAEDDVSGAIAVHLMRDKSYHSEMDIDAAKDRILENNRESDARYKAAAKIYDVIKETKR